MSTAALFPLSAGSSSFNRMPSQSARGYSKRTTGQSSVRHSAKSVRGHLVTQY